MAQMWEGESVPGADVTGVSPVPSARSDRICPIGFGLAGTRRVLRPTVAGRSVPNHSRADADVASLGLGKCGASFGAAVHSQHWEGESLACGTAALPISKLSWYSSRKNSSVSPFPT